MLNHKLIATFAIIALAAVLIAAPLAAGADSSQSEALFADCDTAEKPLRLHVLAASDEPFDQSVKLVVRDQVIAYLEHTLEDCRSKEEAVAAIDSALPLIKQLCDACLDRCGVPYTATVQLETADFPAISYYGVFLAAGDYDALRIVLGPGAGHNWWCVLFPPLCFVDLAAEPDEEAVVAALAETGDDDSGQKEPGYRLAWKLSDLLAR